MTRLKIFRIKSAVTTLNRTRIKQDVPVQCGSFKGALTRHTQSWIQQDVPVQCVSLNLPLNLQRPSFEFRLSPQRVPLLLPLNCNGPPSYVFMLSPKGVPLLPPLLLCSEGERRPAGEGSALTLS